MANTSVTTRERAAADLPLPRLIDIQEVAVHLGVTVRHVRRLVAERRVPFVKWGHLLRFDPGDIAEWVNDARVGRERSQDGKERDEAQLGRRGLPREVGARA